MYSLGDTHPHYGLCVSMGTSEGEPYRMFNNNGSISLIPLNVLELEKEKGR